MDFNEWLLEDRIAVIKDVLVKSNLTPEIVLTDCPQRDMALVNVLKDAGAFENHTGTITPVSSKRAAESEKTAPACAIYDENHRLVCFYPLKVCNDDWVDWYLNKKEKTI